MFLCDDAYHLTGCFTFYVLNVLRFLKGSAGYPGLERLPNQDGGLYCTGFPLSYTMGLWDKGHIHAGYAVISCSRLGYGGPVTNRSKGKLSIDTVSGEVNFSG